MPKEVKGNKEVTKLLDFNPTNNKLNKKSKYLDLEEYVQAITENPQAEPWEVFVERANQSTIEGDEEEDKNKNPKTMRFYRMMTIPEAEETMKNEALQKDKDGGERFVTMSLKHSRGYQNSKYDKKEKPTTFVRFTVDVQQLSQLDEFHPQNFLSWIDTKHKTLANQIQTQRVLEGKPKLNVFETQWLQDHENAKVNLGLREEAVEAFNSCLVEGENGDGKVVELVRVVNKDGTAKMYRKQDATNQGDETPATQRSETSNKSKNPFKMFGKK